MPERFDRDLVVTIGGKVLRMRTEPKLAVVDGELTQELGQSKEILRTTFKINKTNKAAVNQCALEIYNLSPSSRQIIDADGVEVIVQAGYTGSISQAFKGDLSYGENIRAGTDWITVIEAADGGKQTRQSRVQEQTAPGTTARQAMEQLVNALNLDIGNLVEELSKDDLRQGLKDFKLARVLSGNTWNEIQRISKSLGFEVSVQDGACQWLKPGETNGQGAAVIDARAGLIGSPERGNKGIVKVTTLIRPDIIPGRRVRLTSAQLDGDYLCQAVEHTGDTHGTPWYSSLEVKRL